MTPVPKPSPRPKKERKPVKRVNAKRRKSEFARCYHSKSRVGFVRGLPCVVCRFVPSENAHILSGGVSRKADYDKIVPLCEKHHRAIHLWGRETFENICRPLDLDKAAAETEAAWLSYHSGIPK